MNKKKLSLFLIIISLIFTSCWIYPDYKDYKVIDDIYFFEDYETMKAVIIPEINSAFTNWHWSESEFDKKYQKYFNNINVNTDDYSTLISNGYNYSVRHKSATSNLQTLQGKTISSEYFWISTKDNEAVIFYQN